MKTPLSRAKALARLISHQVLACGKAYSKHCCFQLIATVAAYGVIVAQSILELP
ncbi:hypothetical protein [Litoreibacter albidus]|uniref:hypothetical protein n=1 Tax=Litoreibacter albidus TaxID=670155 RepID=UPI001480D73A|nr:hypothetical protein [Litoreibacter albidus]